MKQDSIVYCISVSPEGPCKIGYANHPWRRLSLAQVNNHLPLTLAAILQPERPVRLIEGFLHARFRPDHIRGEWYNVPVQTVIEAMGEYGSVQEWPKRGRGAFAQNQPQASAEELLEAMRAHPRWNVAPKSVVN